MCICIQKLCVFILKITKVHVLVFGLYLKEFANTTKCTYISTNKRQSAASHNFTESRQNAFTPVVGLTVNECKGQGILRKVRQIPKKFRVVCFWGIGLLLLYLHYCGPILF